jgi:hypothetical protein
MDSFGGFVVFCVRLADVTVCDQRAEMDNLLKFDSYFEIQKNP